MMFKLFVLVTMLAGLPLFGIVLAKYPVWRYLESPPQTFYVQHAPLSWIAFAAYGFFILGVAIPLVVRAFHSIQEGEAKTLPTASFPWWGWLGICSGITAWILAWTRFGWFTGLQPHTFTPLWISYILVINALSLRELLERMAGA